MKLAWATDVHLDAVQPEQLVSFGKDLVKDNPDAILLSGDISTGRDIVGHLRMLQKHVQKPILFVLGNHDLWYSSIQRVDEELRQLCMSSENFVRLSQGSHRPLTPRTTLIGADGWYDLLNGTLGSGGVFMRDWVVIEDFLQTGINFNRREISRIVPLCRSLAKLSADRVIRQAQTAIGDGASKLIIVTHIPPFPQVHTHENRPSTSDMHPFYTSRMMGEALLGLSVQFPHVEFEVFCGHTHGHWTGNIRDNLIVNVGAAEYGRPELQKTFVVG